VSETHDVWLHKASLENDTHGFIVLPKQFSEELVEKYASWLNKYLQPFKKGFDEFSGLKIPYLGHEDNAPDFRREYAEIEAAERERTKRIDKLAIDNEKAIKRYRYKERFSITVSVLVLIVIVLVLIIKNQ
jgi:hypothetical protein